MALAPEVGPQQLTVYHVLAAVAQARPDSDLLVLEPVTAATYGLGPGSVSYAQALAHTHGLRQRYADAGYGHGHRVALSLDNRPEFFYHWWALNALGVSVVPVHAALRHAELTYLLSHSACVLVVARPSATPPCAKRLTQAKPSLRWLHLGPSRYRLRPMRLLGGAAGRPRDRMRVAVHLGHHRSPQGMPLAQWLLFACWQLVRHA